MPSVICNNNILLATSGHSLLTLTIDAGVKRSSASVCASVCLSVKNEWSQSVQTWCREWPWDILIVTWFWCWKVTGSQVQKHIRSSGRRELYAQPLGDTVIITLPPLYEAALSIAHLSFCPVPTPSARTTNEKL